MPLNKRIKNSNGMRAKKSLGQNFLRSRAALDAIVDAGDPTGEDIILEIGPGEGVLTERLLALAGKVIAIEKDSRLIPILKEKFEKEIKDGKLDIAEKDILDFNPEILKFYDHPYKVIANIPYYVTGQVIRKFLETEHQPESMTLLVQKEVADRIMVRDGKESILSISVKAYGEPKYIKTVPRGAFAPMPKVDSAIIHIGNINKKRFEEITPSIPLTTRGRSNPEKKFFEILRKGFAHKRKLLMKNLEEFGKEKVKESFERCGIPQNTRAEELKVEDWICLAKNLV